MDVLPPSRARLELLRTSFAILLLELICIRWIPGQIRFIGYFMNFILLASFLGVGLGVLSARRRLPMPPFALLLLGLVLLVTLSEFDAKFFSPEVLFFAAGDDPSQHESFLVLPLVFLAVTLTFVPLARPLAALFKALPPLEAYTFDILGSLAGIATFFVMSAAELPPWVWFTVLALVLVPGVARRQLLFLVPLFGAVIFIASRGDPGDRWSPYYRVMLQQQAADTWTINVNHVGHQVMGPHQQKESFYFRAHDLFGRDAFKNVLVLGAGSGSDVAIALANGAEHVQGVEIDPVIQALGRDLHPDKPFSDPRVQVAIDDGRAFLRNTSEKYDLIIFALPDSLTLTSGFASLRLESFLLTEDAFRSARAHLTDDGLLVAYNYYRFDWLVKKLAGMLERAFGSPPYVTTYGASGRAAVLMAGPRLERRQPPLDEPYLEGGLEAEPQTGAHLPMIGAGRLRGEGHLKPATDDWPFVYMPQPALPGIYLGSLAMVLGIAFLLLMALAPRGTLRRANWHMFFLGAAFMLLEARSLVTFGLLFGTTWMVNSLVFFAILASVLLAIRLSARLRLARPVFLYAALVATLLVNFVVPSDVLAAIASAPLRYVLASVAAFAPIFLANLIFSRAFRDTGDTGDPDTALAWNFLGIMCGGAFEYLALVTGYRFLVLVVAAFYLIAYRVGRAKAPA